LPLIASFLFYCCRFSTILEKNTFNKKAQYNLACIFHAGGYPNLSLPYLKDILLNDPTDSVAHSFLWSLCLSENCSTTCAKQIYSELKKSGDIEAETRLSILTGQGDCHLRGKNSYIEFVFDELAENFENRLVKILDYQAPTLLFALLSSVLERIHKNSIPSNSNSSEYDERGQEPQEQPLDSSCSSGFPFQQWKIVDLGCGSGLCAKAFRSSPLFTQQYNNSPVHLSECFHDSLSDLLQDQNHSWIAGVDLSPKMIALCSPSQQPQVSPSPPLYNYLVSGDLFSLLKDILSCSSSSTRSGVNLVLSADTFIYVGYLGEVFSLVSRILCGSGFFAFSTEDLDSSPMIVPETETETETEGDTRQNRNNDEDEDNSSPSTLSEILRYEVPSVSVESSSHPPKGVKLLKSARFAHSTEYITALADYYEFSVLAEQKILLRKEEGVPLTGNLYVLQRRTKK
jgi:predicted TPR repeat methyltransferase